jgi:glyoxylase-like metal-dependent hydrolase (beta-lactamase superfamily II)
MLIHESFAAGPLQCNCSIIGDSISKKAIVVDPGGGADHILATLKKHELNLVAIIHTHAHLDHILDAGALREATGAPLKLHQEDLFLWDMVGEQCRAFGLPPRSLPDLDGWLKDDEDLGCCGGVTIHTPGHTPGSMSFWFSQHKLLLAGDTLFQGSVGRTDLPGGDFDQLRSSILHRLYTLDEDAKVITGHGAPTTIGKELRSNPFVSL